MDLHTLKKKQEDSLHHFLFFLLWIARLIGFYFAALEVISLVEYCFDPANGYGYGSPYMVLYSVFLLIPYIILFLLNRKRNKLKPLDVAIIAILMTYNIAALLG